MSTTTSLPNTLHPDHSVRPHSGAVVAHFASDDEAQLLRVDAGSTTKESPSPESALAVLANSAVAELRFLHVDETDEAIHLSGQVRSFYHKQLAQEAMRLIAEGRLVVNQVQVHN